MLCVITVGVLAYAVRSARINSDSKELIVSTKVVYTVVVL
jgi:hypothetical protein